MDGLAGSPVVGRCPRQQTSPFPTSEYPGPGIWLLPLPPVHARPKMARRPGAHGAAGARTQGAGPEGNPGRRWAQLSWYPQLARIPRSAVMPKHARTRRGPCPGEEWLSEES